MTEILFFGGVWIALSAVCLALLGRILGQLRREDSPLPETINFHQRRQRSRS